MPEHNAIADPNIHEPKGVAAASSGQVYVADGAGSGDWRYMPHSYCYYDNIGTGTTITTPTSYTVIDPVTIGDSTPKDFTHNGSGRLTYTGATTMDFYINNSITFKHSSGSGQDCFFQVHKNGVAEAGAQNVTTADSANYQQITAVAHIELDTNDYIEVFCKTASGNIIVHAMNLIAGGQI